MRRWTAMASVIDAESVSDQDVIDAAWKRVNAYKNNKGEIKISCNDCAMMYVHKLLQIVDKNPTS